MRTRVAVGVCALLLSAAVCPAAAPDSRPATTAPSGDGKYEILIDTSNVTPELKEWAEATLRPVCEQWYPVIVGMLPSDGFTAPARFTVVFRDDMGGTPAAASGTRVMCNIGWFQKNLKGEAAGAVVHEMVHVVQQYRRPRGPAAGGGGAGGGARNPGWLVEGVADYIRWFKYEPQKRGAEIRDPARARYDASYRVSANFLNHVTERHDKDIVRKLNAAMREGKYNEDLWKQHTGKTVQELAAEWKESLGKKAE